MYPWVTHTHSHLHGECTHRCSYCYMNNPRFGRHANHTGKLRLSEKEFAVDYGTGKTIFIENTNDLFADEVPIGFITEILRHCQMYPENMYVFQTKNPMRYRTQTVQIFLPPKRMFGVTIETNRRLDNNAPPAGERKEWFSFIDESEKTFVTIEPILDFDLDVMLRWMEELKPDFINLGADSKSNRLEEPPAFKVRQLIEGINNLGIEIKEKRNLERLLE